MVFVFDSQRTDRRRIFLTLLMAVGVASHLALLLQDFHLAGKIVPALLFPVWVALPWVLVWGCARLVRGRAAASWWVLVLAVLYLVLGTWAYVDTLYIHPDPQGALIFLFVPLLGMLAALILMAGLWLGRPRPPAPR